jgi:hypothetical protein
LFLNDFQAYNRALLAAFLRGQVRVIQLGDYRAIAFRAA